MSGFRLTASRSLADAAAPGDDTVPDELGMRIIRELRPLLPKTANEATLATCGLSVFEKLNTRPPGFLGTLGLGMLHLGGLVGAVLIPMSLGFAMTARFEAARQAHRGEISCNGFEQRVKDQNLEAPRQHIVASFETPAKAREWTGGRVFDADVDQLLFGRTS